jgi:ubiquinone/menaquinone biosynthesis C-methylase UbiE
MAFVKAQPNAIKLENARKQASKSNLQSDYSKTALGLFVCPEDQSKLSHQSDHFECEKGHRIPIKSGIPDFVVFAKNMTAQKLKQIAFHDDEQINERFEEIVLRPYNYTKPHADSTLYHLRLFRKILSAKMGIDLKDTTILNCGCGGGLEAQYFAENGAWVIGFDISQLRAEASATRFALHGFEGLFYRGDAAVLPFPDNTFDLVIYHDSLHHAPIEEIPIAIREAVRVAKKGVVLLEAHDSPFRMLLETLGLSTSVEASGNYVFRFRKSLMEFFSYQTSTQLVNYSVSFMKKEHRPKLYSHPVLGRLLFESIKLLGTVLRPFGNEACIILRKNR